MKPNNVSDHVTGALHALTDGQRRALGSAVGALSALTERLRDTAD